MKAIVSLNNQGRLTIPDAMRKAMHLEPGAQLELETQGNDLILRPVLVVPREDSWAYTPEHLEHVRRAQTQPAFPISPDEMTAIIDADDPHAAAEEVIAARTHE